MPSKKARPTVKKKTTTKKSSSSKTTKVSVLNVHGGGKIAKIKQDNNCSASINDFVVDKLKIGSFQLVTQPDDSGKIVRVADAQAYEGTDLYVKERNKPQA